VFTTILVWRLWFALAALALVVFGACDSYPTCLPPVSHAHGSAKEGGSSGKSDLENREHKKIDSGNATKIVCHLTRLFLLQVNGVFLFAWFAQQGKHGFIFVFSELCTIFLTCYSVY